MKTLIALLLLLAGSVSAQDAIFNYPRIVSSTSSGAATSPGGTVTGAVQYRTAGGAFGGDDSLIDNGAGLLTAVGVSSTNISVTNLVLTSSTLLAGQNLYARLNGSAFVVDGSGGFQYNAATDRSIFAETDLPANTTPSATVHVSGTLIVVSNTTFGSISPSAALISAYGNVSASIFFANDAVDTAILPSFSFSNDTNTGMFNTVADAIGFTTGGTERFRTMGGGTPRATMTTNFMIGGAITDFPSSTLHVSGTMIVTSNTFLTGLTAGTATNNLCITATGLVISSTTLSGCLGVSDPALKKDIHPLAYGLAEVLAVDAVTYKDIRPGGSPATQVGFLAYSVDRDGMRYRGLEAVMPDLVDPKATYYNGRYYKGVIYERAIAVAYKAIQQQQAQIATLQAAVDELRAMQGMAPLATPPWWKFWATRTLTNAGH